MKPRFEVQSVKMERETKLEHNAVTGNLEIK